MASKPCDKCGEKHANKLQRLACETERLALIEAARAEWGTDDLEIDDDARISRITGGDLGTWVQAWVWIADE